MKPKHHRRSQFWGYVACDGKGQHCEHRHRRFSDVLHCLGGLQPHEVHISRVMTGCYVVTQKERVAA